MKNKKRVQKKVNRRCPYCDGELELVIRSKQTGGVLYQYQFEECIDCGFSEEIVNKKNRKRLELKEI